jgi:hypothetical protein
VSWPVTLLGVLAAVLLAVGLVFPYIELWKNHGRVVGISFRFLAIDFAGAFFSLLALVVQNTFDRLGGASYITVMILEIGIVLCHLFWLWRSRKTRNAAKKAGKDYNEYMNTLDPEPKTVRSSFVRIQDIPRDWPTTVRVSAILSALRASPDDEEKGSEAMEADIANGRRWPSTVHVSAIVAAIHKASCETKMSTDVTRIRQFNDEKLVESQRSSSEITKPATTAQTRGAGNVPSDLPGLEHAD